MHDACVCGILNRERVKNHAVIMTEVEGPAPTSTGYGTSVVVLKSGFAVKEGLVWKTWRRRWCVLRTVLPVEMVAIDTPTKTTHVLMYYAAEKDAILGEKPSGVMYLSKGNTTVSKVSRTGRDCLQIQTVGCARVYFFQPEQDMDGWLCTLTELDQPAKSPPASPT